MKLSKNLKVSTKHLRIDKANQRIVIAVSVAAALVVFSAISINAIISQIKYNQLVLGERNKANKQLEENYEEAQVLFNMFQAFENTPESIIGTPDKNSKVVLDALPSKYDFPAVAVYIDSILTMSGVASDGFSGQDEEASAVQISDSPEPILIPLGINGSGNITSARQLIDNLYRSVRPVKISTISLEGNDSAMKVTIVGNTYYQPQKDYTVKEEIVKPSGSKNQQTTNTTQSNSTTGNTDDAATGDVQ